MEPICAFPGLRVSPIEKTLHMVGKKWTVPVILEINRGNHRFSSIKKRLPEVSSRMLSMRLKDLQRFGLIHKLGRTGTRMPEYRLTEKGSALLNFLASAGKYSMLYSK